MIEHLPVHLVKPDPNQPRKSFDDNSIAQLGQSIRERGLLQPIRVRPDGEGGYFVVMGERRWRAHRVINAETIPAIVDIGEKTAAQIMADQLIENLEREDMNPLETAKGLRALLDSGWPIEKIAQTLGYDPVTVERKLSLNNLEARIQKYVASGQISESVALLLTKLSAEGQYLALRRIRGRSVAQARPIVDAILEAEQQVNLFATPEPTRQQKSLVRRYSMAMLALTAFVKAITTDDYRILASGLDNGKLGKRIAEIDLATKGLRRIKRELETYQQSKRFRKAAA